MRINHKTSHPMNLMFISGLFAGGWIWDRIINYLPNDKFNIIKQEFPLSRLGDNIPSLITNLSEVIQRKKDNSVILFGNSLGGLLALDLARRHPGKVVSVIASGCPGLEDVNLGIGIPKRNDERWFKLLVDTLFVDSSYITESHIKKTQKLFQNRRTFLNIVRLSKETSQYSAHKILYDIKCPILFIWGENDIVTPPKPWQQISTNFTNVDFHLIKSCGHSPMIEKPFVFFEIMNQFLNEKVLSFKEF